MNIKKEIYKEMKNMHKSIKTKGKHKTLWGNSSNAELFMGRTPCKLGKSFV